MSVAKIIIDFRGDGPRDDAEGLSLSYFFGLGQGLPSMAGLLRKAAGLDLLNGVAWTIAVKIAAAFCSDYM